MFPLTLHYQKFLFYRDVFVQNVPVRFQDFDSVLHPDEKFRNQIAYYQFC